MAFLGEFNKQFKEGLAQYGFVYNSKYKAHVRMVNGEILQYIMYESEMAYQRGNKAFTIFAGMLSVYCEELTREDLQMFGERLYNYSYDKKDLRGWEYNDSTMLEMIERSLVRTKEVILPFFDQVTDLNSYIEFKKYYGIDSLDGVHKFRYDSLVFFKADNHDDFMDLFTARMEEIREKLKKEMSGEELEEAYQKAYAKYHECLIEHIPEYRDKIYNDPDLYAKAIAEADRRREANLQQLRDFKLIK